MNSITTVVAYSQEYVIFIYNKTAEGMPETAAFAAILCPLKGGKGLCFMRVMIKNAKRTTTIMEELKIGFTELWVYPGGGLRQ